MKKVIALLIVFTILLSMSGCINKNKNIVENKQNAVSTSKEKNEKNEDGGDNIMEEWIGKYNTNDSSHIEGNIDIYKDENQNYRADLIANSTEGTIEAKLSVSVENDILVLCLLNYLTKNTITKFEIGDPVLCMKKENGKLLTKINLDDMLEKWDEIFLKES